MENAWQRGWGGFMTRRAAVLWAFSLTLSFGCVAAWSDSSDGRPLASSAIVWRQDILRGGLLGVPDARLRVPRCVAPARSVGVS